jgi:hypothetical protein
MMEALGESGHDFGSRMLYRHNFPDWFVTHVESYYSFDWDSILRNLRNRRFFYPGEWASQSSNITGEYLDEKIADELGEMLIQRLAALLATVLTSRLLKNASKRCHSERSEESRLGATGLTRFLVAFGSSE